MKLGKCNVQIVNMAQQSGLVNFWIHDANGKSFKVMHALCCKLGGVVTEGNYDHPVNVVGAVFQMSRFWRDYVP